MKSEAHIIHATNLDLDKLAYAVSVAETSGCTDGTALRRNNCHGIMAWDKNGKRYPRYFKTKAESFVEFKRIWKRSYKIFPTYSLAVKWTGDENAARWLAIVKEKYYN